MAGDMAFISFEISVGDCVSLLDVLETLCFSNSTTAN
jgi:hypothetical protein